MLPTFLLIGGTKCGTTSLYQWLDDHPAIFVAKKETRFFSRAPAGDPNDVAALATAPHTNERGLAWYERQFDGAGTAEAIGDASNAYTRDPVYPGVPERIRAALPEARLVYLVRHPLRRIESHYRHRLVMGTEWRSAERALRTDPSYVAASLYGHQLDRYREIFPAEQVLTVRSEALFADPQHWLAKIEAFIGVTRSAPYRLPKGNVTAKRRAVPLALRQAGRVPALRRALPRVPGALDALGLSRLGPPADAPPFELSDGFAAELRERFAVDRARLAALAGPEVADWSLDE